MKVSRILCCLLGVLSLCPHIAAGENGVKRLYLPCVAFSYHPHPETVGKKLPVYISLPVKVMGVDYQDFVARKDKTPAERFIAEVFAAVADGTVVAKYLSGYERYYLMLASPEAKRYIFQGLRFEYLGRADGEYFLLYRRGDDVRHYFALHFSRDKEKHWKISIDALQFHTLLAKSLRAAVERGEEKSLFTNPGLKYTVGVNFNEEKWHADIMTPDSEFKIHFNARPLNMNFRRPGAYDKDDALTAAIYAHYRENSPNPRNSRFAYPVAVVDAGDLAWVVYDDRMARDTGRRPMLQNVFYQKGEDGKWGYCREHLNVAKAFELSAINVLNTVRPLVK